MVKKRGGDQQGRQTSGHAHQDGEAQQIDTHSAAPAVIDRQTAIEPESLTPGHASSRTAAALLASSTALAQSVRRQMKHSTNIGYPLT